MREKLHRALPYINEIAPRCLIDTNDLSMLYNDIHLVISSYLDDSNVPKLIWTFITGMWIDLARLWPDDKKVVAEMISAIGAENYSPIYEKEQRDDTIVSYRRAIGNWFRGRLFTLIESSKEFPKEKTKAIIDMLRIVCERWEAPTYYGLYNDLARKIAIFNSEISQLKEIEDRERLSLAASLFFSSDIIV